MAKKTVSKTPKAPAASSTGNDWRRETLDRVRALILKAAPGAVEEAKWVKATNPAGVPTWSQDGIICTGESYKDKVKLTFMRGAALKDPSRLLSAGLEGGTRRSIDIREGDHIDEKSFLALIREVAALNAALNGAKAKRA